MHRNAHRQQKHHPTCPSSSYQYLVATYDELFARTHAQHHRSYEILLHIHTTLIMSSHILITRTSHDHKLVCLASWSPGAAEGEMRAIYILGRRICDSFCRLSVGYLMLLRSLLIGPKIKNETLPRYFCRLQFVYFGHFGRKADV